MDSEDESSEDSEDAGPHKVRRLRSVHGEENSLGMRSAADGFKECARLDARLRESKNKGCMKDLMAESSKEVCQWWRRIAADMKGQMDSLLTQADKQASQQRLEEIVNDIEATSGDLARRLCVISSSSSSSSSSKVPVFDSKKLSAHVTTPVPWILTKPLRSYQHIGLHWLATLYDAELNGILADEMGLGKTIMTIALLAHLALEKNIWGPHLIIVPTSVLLNWVDEFYSWTPGLKVMPYHGSAADRTSQRQGRYGFDHHNVVVTSYSIALQDELVFRRKQWHYMVLDEAQNIKNSNSKKWQSLVGFNSVRRLMLTGTPLQNDLMELWSLMSFLMPDRLGSRKDFKEWFSDPMNKAVIKNEVDHEVVKKLHNVLRPFMFRRLKSEVELELPRKYEHVVNCRMSAQQKKLYNEFLDRREVQKALHSSDYLRVLNICMQLRKVCTHPELFLPRLPKTPYTMEPIELVIPGRVFMSLHETVGNRSAGCRPAELSFTSHLLRRLSCRRGTLEPLASCTSAATMGSVGDALVRKFQCLRYLRPAPFPGCQSQVKSAGTPGGHMSKLCWVAGHWITSKGARGQQKDTWKPSVGERVWRRLMRSFMPDDNQDKPSGSKTAVLLGKRGLSNVEVAFIEAGADPKTCRSRKRVVEDSAGNPAGVLHGDVPKAGTLIHAGRIGTVINDNSDGQMPKGYVMVSWDAVSASVTREIISVEAIQPVSKETDQGEAKNLEPPRKRPRRLKLLLKDTSVSPEEESQSKIFQSRVKMDETLFSQLPLFGKKGLGERSFEPISCDSADSTLGTIFWDLADGISLDSRDGLMQLTCVRDEFSTFSAISFKRLHQEANLSVCLQRLEAKICNLSYLRHSVFRVLPAQFMGPLPRSLVRVPEMSAPSFPSDEVAVARDVLARQSKLVLTGAGAPGARLHLDQELREQLRVCQKATNDLFCRNPSAEAALKRINCGSYLLAPLPCRLPDKRFLELDCGKLQELTGMLTKFKSEGSKCIIFTQFTHMLNLLEEYACFHNFRYVRLDGSTKVEMRQTLVRRFNNVPGIFLFLASTRAGGVGINLTAANVVIFYDSDWNPAIDRQATDRAHRIGQTREVHIYRMITEKSVEQNIWQRQLQKRMLDDVVIDQGSFSADSMLAIAKKQQAWSLNTVRSLVTGKEVAENPAENVPENVPRSSPGEASTSENESLGAALFHVEDEEDGKAALELFSKTDADSDADDSGGESTHSPGPGAPESVVNETGGDCNNNQLGIASVAAYRLALGRASYPKGRVVVQSNEEKKWTPADLVTSRGTEIN